MSPNAQLAGTTLRLLSALGVRDFVLCAGARNAPLVNSLLCAPPHPQRRLWHHFDERTAAFFALGLTKRHGAPAAVLTTSGTAVAELLPAAIEAHYSGLPLLLITADRPASFRGSGAPQAIEQLGLFGPYAHACDLSQASALPDLSAWDRRRPLHLNLCFEEPHSQDGDASWASDPSPLPMATAPHSSPARETMAKSLARFLESRDGLVVILGALEASWRNEVRAFLKALGCPLWAESTSGLRECPDLAPWRLPGEPPLPQRVLRLGGVPSLRLWRDLEAHPEIPVLSLSRQPFSGLARPSELLVAEALPPLLPTIPQGPAPAEVPTDPREPRLESLLTAHPGAEPALLRELSRHIPSEALVFLGNSLPIREWNLAASLDPAHPRCAASRGANGIDGQIATFLGRSEGEAEAWGIFGDLTALYDLNAPALLPQLSPGRRRLVILNNGGGRIFSRLPSLAGLSNEAKVLTENRHQRRFDAWAAMWGMDYQLWQAHEPFPESDAEALVIEVLPDEAATEAFWAAWQ